MQRLVRGYDDPAAGSARDGRRQGRGIEAASRHHPQRRSRRRELLTACEAEVLENHLQAEVAAVIQRLLQDSERRLMAINAELSLRLISTGIKFRLVWQALPESGEGAPVGLEAAASVCSTPVSMPGRSKTARSSAACCKTASPANALWPTPMAAAACKTCWAGRSTTGAGTASACSAGRTVNGGPCRGRRRAVNGRLG